MALCPHCNIPQNDENNFCIYCGESLLGMNDRKIEEMRIYKVLRKKDFWFTGRFDALKLEKILNEYARHGWRFLAFTTASARGFGSKRDEILAIMEKIKKIP